MFIPRRRLIGFGYRLVISLGIILLILSGFVVSQTSPGVPGDAKIFIQSRFLLWDAHEKMIDGEFNITFISYDNQTHNYIIKLDEISYNGSYSYYTIVDIKYNYSIINSFIVLVDGNRSFEAYDIQIVEGISRGFISNLIETIKIEFLPIELTRFEWNLVTSGIVGAVICLPVSYFTVKYYRKYRGAKEV